MDPLRFRLRVLLITFLAVLVVGTLCFMVVENVSLTDAFYFCIVTITTVGYGDIHPATALGKLVAILLIVMGVGTFLGVIANATEMMLNRREKQARLEKIHMLIGVFFSEVGTRLIALFSNWDPQLGEIQKELIVTSDWTEQEFRNVARRLRQRKYAIAAPRVDFDTLRRFLLGKRDFLVGLFENPFLIEHEAFTHALRAVFHLAEELACREDLTRLPDSDKAHLAGDVERAYRSLAGQWLDYMKHLKNNYPYLFSLAMRTNPFDREASPIVK